MTPSPMAILALHFHCVAGTTDHIQHLEFIGLSLRSTVQPLYSRFPNRFSSCFSEAAIGYDPNRTADVISTATNAPPHPDGRLHGGSDPLVHLRARFGCPRLLSGAEEMYCIVNAECRMHTAECTLQNAHCRMQNAECKYYMYR
jgi:hypothetical protein